MRACYQSRSALSRFVTTLTAFVVAMSNACAKDVIPMRADDNPTAAFIHVLVVDDNRDFAETLSALLGLAGYRTACVFDGDGAMAMVRLHRPLVVVTDLAMPGRNGFELLASVRAEPSCSDAFMVAVSGWGGGSMTRSARAAGFDACFMKPCEHAELMKTVAHAVYKGSILRERAGTASASGGTG